jgi:hemoglobin
LCEAEAVRPSLFECAGGEAAFLALARAHHARCLADPMLNHVFSHDDQHPQHVERLAVYWAEVLGGPPTYSHECGDESALLQLHVCNEEITELGERFLDCFVRALDDAGLSDDAEFRDAMRAYMRWAVDNVLTYSSGETPVPAAAAMPRWGWNGLEQSDEPVIRSG